MVLSQRSMACIRYASCGLLIAAGVVALYAVLFAWDRVEDRKSIRNPRDREHVLRGSYDRYCAGAGGTLLIGAGIYGIAGGMLPRR